MPEQYLPQDYHLHTTFSMDSKMAMENACHEAVRRGLAEICFTEHVDCVPEDEGAGFFNPAAYMSEVDRCRDLFDGSLTVRAGIEFGEPHRFGHELERLLDGYPWDFVIGSLHWVGPELVMTPDYFDGKTQEQAYLAYFEEMLALVSVANIDIVGHLDVPKRYAVDRYGLFDSCQFAEPIRAVLRTCVERGIGIEINTGTMRRTGNDPSPSPEVIGWYRELGGEILTLGSDGHRPAHMAYAFDQAVEFATQAGFSHVTLFERRQPRFVPLT